MAEPTGERAAAPLLGRCPRCDAFLPAEAASIEFEPADGWPVSLAECPSCFDVVHPR